MLALVRSIASWTHCRFRSWAAQELRNLSFSHQPNVLGNQRPGRLAIFTLTAAAAILRISFLDSKSFWLDEGTTAKRVTLPLDALLKVIRGGRTNMSLYYLVLHGWTSVAGTSEFTIRLPSALFDAATVPLVYALGTELSNRRVGLVAALLVSVNATSIRYAQTARSYSMYVALATLASIFFIRSVQRNSSPTNLVGYVVSGALSIYTQLFGIFAVPSQWLSVFLFRLGKKDAIRLTICALVIEALSLPAFFFGISGHHGSLAWIPKTSFNSVVELVLSFAGAFDGQVTSLSVILAGLYIVGFLFAILWTRRPDWPPLGYLLLSLCFPICVTIAISFIEPLFVTRYLLAGLPLFAVLAAIGFQRMKPPFAIAIVCAIVLLSLTQDYYYYRSPAVEDWRGVVDFVAKRAQPGDTLVVWDGAAGFDYYLSRSSRERIYPVKVFYTRVSGNPALSSEELLGHSEGGRVWVTFAAWEGLDKTVMPLILRHAQVLDQPQFSGVRLFLLERGS
jgi:mannosyltransferase